MNNKEKKLEINIQLRSLQENVVNGKISAEDAKKKIEELRAKKSEIEKAIALENAPVETRSAVYADVAKAIIEKRAIALNGTGVINQVRELIKEFRSRTPVLEKVRYFYGASAQTNIPVLSPTIAVPGNYAEGATTISADTQAVLGNSILTPYAYISLLPISAEAISLGSIQIENELSTIFADAFSQAFHSGILTGDGTERNFSGIFTSIPSGNKIQCAATGNPTVADLVDLALSVRDLTDNATIILSPAVYSKIMADATTGVADLYKEELIRSKTIEGVNVIVTSGAPASVTAGSVVAAAGSLEQYAVGLASEITIDPIKKPGDSNTYFQATVFANGKPIIAKNFYGLVTKSA